jgi:hypothetical protein
MSDETAPTEESIVPVSSQVRPAMIVDAGFLSENGSMLRRFLVALVSEGFSPIVAGPGSLKGSDILSPSVEVAEYPVFRIPLLWMQNFTLLLETLDDLGPTVLHCLSPRRIGLTEALAEALDVPYVATFTRWPRMLFRPKVRGAYCGQLIGTTAAVTGRLGREYSSMAASICQVSAGDFVEDRCACYAQPNRQTSILAVQPLEDERFFEALLNAVRHLAIDGRDFALAILGQGKASGMIHQTIRKLGLSRMVTVAPVIEPLQTVLSAADLFLQSGQPLDINSALLDAMSVGMAVALSKGGLEETLIAGKAAEYFDPADEYSIYACLQKLLTQKDYAQSLARGAQEYMRQHHSVSRMTEEMIGIYQHAQQWYQAQNNPAAGAAGTESGHTG